MGIGEHAVSVGGGGGEEVKGNGDRCEMKGDRSRGDERWWEMVGDRWGGDGVVVVVMRRWSN